jgi:hypothetical protein
MMLFFLNQKVISDLMLLLHAGARVTLAMKGMVKQVPTARTFA